MRPDMDDSLWGSVVCNRTILDVAVSGEIGISGMGVAVLVHHEKIRQDRQKERMTQTDNSSRAVFYDAIINTIKSNSKKILHCDI